MAQIAQQNNGMDLSNLLQIFRPAGGSTTGPVSTTTTTNVSQDAVNELVRQILQSNSGLAAIASGQKGAGLYNSTVNQQLTNDLIARTATAGASQNKTETTTKSAVTTTPKAQLDLAKTLMSLGTNYAVKKGASYLKDQIFGSSSGNGISADSGGASASGGLSSDGVGGGLDIGASSGIESGGLSSLSAAESALGDSAGSYAADAMSSSALGSATESGGLASLSAADSAAGDSAGAIYAADDLAASGAASDAAGAVVADGAASAAGESALAAGAAGTAGEGLAAGEAGGMSLGSMSGAALGGWVALAIYSSLTAQRDFGSGAEAAGGNVGDIQAADIWGGFGTGQITRAYDTGNVEDAAGPASSILKGDSIICTELYRQKKMSKLLYSYSAHTFNSYDARGKQGYYFWSIAAVKHLKKYPDSILSSALCKIFNLRAEYVSAKAGSKRAKRTLSGAVITHSLYAICWILSRTVARKPIDFRGV